jgi:hypothetical protein
MAARLGGGQSCTLLTASALTCPDIFGSGWLGQRAGDGSMLLRSSGMKVYLYIVMMRIKIKKRLFKDMRQ